MKYLLIFLLVFVSVLNIANAGINVLPDKDANGKIITTSDAFAAKSSYNFQGVGNVCAVAANTTTNCEYTVSAVHVKFNGIAILNTAFGEKANLKILDTPAGTYTLALTGTAIPNFTLNQFGFDWNMHQDKTVEILPYPADLNQGMRIVIEYTNGPVAKSIYVNHYLHKE